MSASAAEPDNLGVENGKLAKCPSSPNCVSTQADDEEHGMAAVKYNTTSAAAMETIESVIEENFPRAKQVHTREHYLHYEFTSFLFRFVDDVEFLIDDTNKQIHFRSASRVGYSDLGANRKRMAKISRLLTSRFHSETSE